MASVLAIISKTAFEKAHEGAKVGDVLAIDAYTTAHKAFEPLRHGGALFLVTVRPPAVLWLVAVLETPFFEDGAWRAQLNATPITDITPRVPGLVFENGQGISGAIAQALQTPRVLTESDEKLLRDGGAGVATEQTEADLVDLMIDADEAARVVFMDWLLERGDPRGMSMRNEVERPLERDEQLALGPLFKVTTARDWSRGLLEGFELRREEAADGDTWQRAMESPWLRTVKRIDRGKAKPPRYRAFTTSALAQSVMDITAANLAFVEKLVAVPRRALRRLAVEKPSDDMRDLLVAAAPTALPRLCELAIHTRDRELAAAVRDWHAVTLPSVQLVLRAPHDFDQSDAIRTDMITWLRTASPPAETELFAKWRALSTFRTRPVGDLFELEIITDDFATDEILLVKAMLPLARFILTPRGDTVRHLDELLDNANSWWLGQEVRRVLRQIPRERIELRGVYQRLAPLLQ